MFFAVNYLLSFHVTYNPKELHVQYETWRVYIGWSDKEKHKCDKQNIQHKMRSGIGVNSNCKYFDCVCFSGLAYISFYLIDLKIESRIFKGLSRNSI